MAEKPAYFMDEFTPTAEEVAVARELLATRRQASAWRRLDPTSEPGRSYCMACAIVADQSPALERMLAPEFRADVDIGEDAEQTPVRDGLRRRLLAAVSQGGIEIWAKPLPFFRHRELVEFRLPTTAGPLAVRFVCVEPDHWNDVSVMAAPLTGKSAEIHSLNSVAARDNGGKGVINIDVEDGQAEEYLRFFNAHVAADDGYFHVIECREDFLANVSAGDFGFAGGVIYPPGGECSVVWIHDEKTEDAGGTAAVPTIHSVMEHVIPLTRMRRGSEIYFAASIVYADALFNVVYRLTPRGMVEMTKDFSRFDEDPLPITAVRDLNRQLGALNVGTRAGAD